MHYKETLHEDAKSTVLFCHIDSLKSLKLSEFKTSKVREPLWNFIFYFYCFSKLFKKFELLTIIA